MFDIVIIGGGASGLMAAATAGKYKNSRVTVIEKNERPARKVMITGKGRCNLTNDSDNETLIKNTVRNGKFMYSAFNAFSSADTKHFFEESGVALKTERGNRVFPQSDKAVDIVDALVKCAQKNAAIICDSAVKIKTVNGKVTAVVCESGRIVEADAVIIATGGASYPLTGSTGDGYAFAKETGHTVTDIRPSLTDIVCHEGFCSVLAGLSLKNVTLSLFKADKKKPVYKELGEMLFTHSGISGPLGLTASCFLDNIKNEKYTIKIDLKPALDFETLDKRILRDFKDNINCNFGNSLSKLLPKSIIPVVVKLSGIDAEKKVNQISAEERRKLVSILKEFTLTVTGTDGFDRAVITRGGVDIKEINPATMESKKVSGLYFAGEVMDVDAFTGGFNLQIAFSSGYLAGKSAAEKGELL